MGTYGLIEREVSTGSDYTPDEAIRVATEYIRKHKRPKISVEISAQELSSITGESLDSFTIGKLFRLVLPEYNTTVEKNVTKLSFSDVYGKPEVITVTLADEEDTAINYLHELDKGGETSTSRGGGGGGRKKQDDKWKEYRTRFEMDDYHIALISEHLNRANEILQQAGMDIDSQTGVLIWHTDNENMAGAKFSVQATAIESLVTKTGINSLGTSETLYSKMTQNAEGITTLVGKTGIESLLTGETLYSKWSQSADAITGIVTKTGINNLGQNETLYSKWSQSADDITGLVAKTGINSLGQSETLIGKINVNADKVGMVVGTQNGLHYIKAAEITASINNAGEGVATIDADKVYIGNSKSTTVINGKVDATDITAQFINAKFANANMVVGGSIDAGSIDVEGTMSSGYVETGNCICDYLNGNDADNIIIDASVSGNTLTLTKSDQSTVTFSKATTLTGTWSGGILTVSASPQGNSKTFGIMDVGASQITWNGNVASVPLKANMDGGETTYNTGKTITVDASARWTAGFNAGEPSAVTIGTKITGTVYNVSVARGSYSAKALTVDAASVYSEGKTAGATSLSISGASTTDTTTKLMDGNYKWKITATTTKGDGTSYTKTYVVESKHDMGIRQSKSGATMTVTAACQPDGSHDAATKSRDYTLEYSNGQAHIMYNGTSYADLTCGGGNYTKVGTMTLYSYNEVTGRYYSQGYHTWYYK